MSTLIEPLINTAYSLGKGTQIEKKASTFVMLGANILMIGPEQVSSKHRELELERLFNAAEQAVIQLGLFITQCGSGEYVDPVELVDLDGKNLHQ